MGSRKMSNIPESFYVKFRIDEMDAFIISEDKDRVDQWKADRRPEGDTAPPREPVSTNVFQEIATAFEKAINSLQNTVPFVMQMIPLILQLMDDGSLRKFAQKRGDLLEKGEFETYSLSV
jgi:hypothetical protein